MPIPSRDVTNQTLSGREQLIIPGQKEFGYSDIPAEDRQIANLFSSVVCYYKTKGGREDVIRCVLISDRGDRHVTELAFYTVDTFELTALI